jgi:phosphoenolpyruvate synthase/pyruvate phosphate dikinase
VVERHPGTKDRMTVPVPGGTATVGVPRRLRDLPCLPDEQVVDTARLALALEDGTRRPCDVECAWRDGRLWLLQCRPVTTLVTGIPR